ncbi:hypothetical protein [Swingsia samuiensis]|uniref:DUF883 family protein n=1 Tax=Swingsia samuiensis TaxID=1293412 RepID=A0A4Y6UI20_9PROT|nr:hypothetical protein [Swingsia samuiensis]QDH17162.1 hypothetical protein E3D00_05975 [Swingsia samuiensis]
MSRNDVKKNIDEAVEKGQDQVQDLRSQIEQILNERVSPVLQRAVSRTDQVVANVRHGDHELQEVVTEHVKSRPIAAILISAAIGFVLGRFSK